MSTQLLTPDEVAELLQVSSSTIRRWAREGLITKIVLPAGRQIRFRRDEIDRLMGAPSEPDGTAA